MNLEEIIEGNKWLSKMYYEYLLRYISLVTKYKLLHCFSFFNMFLCLSNFNLNRSQEIYSYMLFGNFVTLING